MKEMWKILEDSFIKAYSSTYERFVFFFSEQQKGKSGKSFYGRLIEQPNIEVL